MLYLDTAVVLTLFLQEPSTSKVEAWLQKQKPDYAFSDWGLTEVASALGIRRRRGDFTAKQAAHAWQSISAFVHQHCQLLTLGPQHQTAAQQWFSRSDLNLRAGDALHLAIAQAHNQPLVSYDRQLLESMDTLGIDTHNPTQFD